MAYIKVPRYDDRQLCMNLASVSNDANSVARIENFSSNVLSRVASAIQSQHSRALGRINKAALSNAVDEARNRLGFASLWLINRSSRIALSALPIEFGCEQVVAILTGFPIYGDDQPRSMRYVLESLMVNAKLPQEFFLASDSGLLVQAGLHNGLIDATSDTSKKVAHQN